MMPDPCPRLLQPDNFTLPSRTPWGGVRIKCHYKRNLELSAEKAAYRAVGEAWELSLDPKLPSTLADNGQSLIDVLREAPGAWLGREAGCNRDGTALLIKLIDTADHLSLQIHPPDDYSGLAPEECGKEECWYVLDHEPGAGLLLGLAEGVAEAEIRQCLATQGDLSALLGFVPVQRGDFFLVTPGTPHAIGKGMTLAEVQHALPGKSAVTYRYWDWNRRYDADGRPAPEGRPRPLHVDHALRVTAWSRVAHQALLSCNRASAPPPTAAQAARLQWLCGPPPAPVLSRYLQVAMLGGSGSLTLPDVETLRAVSVFDGQIELSGEPRCRIETGCTAIIPACARQQRALLHKAHALLSSVAVP